MSHQSPGEPGRGRKREFLLRLEALAILPNSNAMRKQKRTTERKGKNRYEEQTKVNSIRETKA